MPGRPALLAGVALALQLLAGSAGLAQAAGELRQGLGALQREVAAARDTLVLVQAEPDPSRLAALEIRLSRLEEELRRLTGRLEELEFGDRATEARLDELVADLDARLERLDPGGRRAAAPAGPDAASVVDAEPAPAASAVDPVPTSPGVADRLAEDPAAREGFVLGRLNPDAQSDAAAAPRAAPDTPKGQYDAALARLQRGDFSGARDEFATFVASHPTDPLAASAAYWMAETHYVEGDLDTAAAMFARNYQHYGPDAPKGPDNLLKMGLALSQIGQREEACQTFAELERRHPNAPAPIKQATIRGKVGAACS